MDLSLFLSIHCATGISNGLSSGFVAFVKCESYFCIQATSADILDYLHYLDSAGFNN